MSNYRGIADHIRWEIREGGLPPGSRLPSGAQLCARHRCAEITIRRAFKILEAEGLIETVPRRGRYVAGGDPEVRRDSRRELVAAFLRDLPSGKLVPTTGLLMLQFQCGQATVRRAVRQVKSEGALASFADGRLVRT